MATRKPKTLRVSPKDLSRVMASLGQRGGRARAQNRTPAELSAIGKLGGVAFAKAFRRRGTRQVPEKENQE